MNAELRHRNRGGGGNNGLEVIEKMKKEVIALFRRNLKMSLNGMPHIKVGENKFVIFNIRKL
jgi:hypothetical protein